MLSSKLVKELKEKTPAPTPANKGMTLSLLPLLPLLPLSHPFPSFFFSFFSFFFLKRPVSEAQICKEIREMMKQICASVTFLPLLEEEWFVPPLFPLPFPPQNPPLILNLPPPFLLPSPLSPPFSPFSSLLPFLLPSPLSPPFSPSPLLLSKVLLIFWCTLMLILLFLLNGRQVILVILRILSM